jgi:hypothetical protein
MKNAVFIVTVVKTSNPTQVNEPSDSMRGGELLISGDTHITKKDSVF